MNELQRTFAREVLSLVAEDDYGLWEILWRATSVLPAIDPEERETVVAQVLLDMLDQGLIEFYERRKDTDRRATLSAEEAARLMRQPHHWQAPTRGSSEMRIGATSRGEQAYFTRGSGTA